MRSNHLLSTMLGAALFTLACAPVASAAGNSMTIRGNFIIFRGFPTFTQESSRFVRFTPSPQATAFPLGLCCVTGATPPEARVIVVENPPVPESKPAPPKEASVEIVLGVTVMRGVATHH